MSSASKAEWLEDLCDEVQSRAVAEALSDVPDLGDGSAVTWIKRERRGDAEIETVFVLAGRLLHRLSGQIDPSERGPEWVGSTTCAYDVLIISGESSYRIRLQRGSAANGVAWTKRWWTFEFNPDEAGLEIEYSRGTETKRTPGPDPGRFVGALVATIARAQAQADENA